ncbi:MAG: chloramphenicol acetyltransferase [Dysgonamonadaceae bacterium]
MKTLINIENWVRKEHYLFFSQFDEPFYGIVTKVDCTNAYRIAKKKHISFYLYYLYRVLKTVNEIENFKYRIIDKEVYLYDRIDVSSTIDRPNKTFGFAYIDYQENENLFYEKACQIVDEVRQSDALITAGADENLIHSSAVPWIDFTGISHARNFRSTDSCPKFSYGKVTEDNGKRTMPISIHVHHGLVDGYHLGLFMERFQELMNEAG